MKNWDLFVSGPEFAIAKMPRLLNLREDRHDIHTWLWATRNTYLESRANLIRERFAPNALTALPRSRGVAGLCHEALDVPMPEGIIIVA